MVNPVLVPPYPITAALADAAKVFSDRNPFAKDPPAGNRPAIAPRAADRPIEASPFDKPQSYQWNLQKVADCINLFNFPITEHAIRALEWCDEPFMPAVIRETCQNVLTKQWGRKLPLIQANSPAYLACKQLMPHLDDISTAGKWDLEVFEFCAGSGGPTPIFSRLINQHRASRGQKPLHFSISDKYPNPEAWKQFVKDSNNLTAVFEPVDAIEPPPIALRWTAEDYMRHRLYVAPLSNRNILHSCPPSPGAPVLI